MAGVTTDPKQTGVTGPDDQDGAAAMPKAPSVNGICLAQFRNTAGALTLNGADVVAGAWPCSHAGGFRIALASASNLSGVNVTLNGLDKVGAVQSEAMAGPNANTVLSTKHYSAITSITVDASMSSHNMTVGYSYPLVSIPAAARGHVFSLINEVDSFVSALGAPLVTLDFPAALWTPNRAIRIITTIICGGGGGLKNPYHKLGGTTLRDLGASVIASAAVSIEALIVKSGAAKQKCREEFFWVGLNDNYGVVDAVEDDTAIIPYKMFCDGAGADGDLLLKAMTAEVLNSP